MGLLWWIIIGGLAGAIAKWIMPGRDPGGCLLTLLLGMAGAVVGGWVLGALLPSRDTGPAGLLGAVLGALILLGVYRWLAKRDR